MTQPSSCRADRFQPVLFAGLAALAVSVMALPATAHAAPVLVSVTNTPSVTVANPLSIATTPANPLIVDAGSDARTAAGAQCNANFDASGTATCLLGAVPVAHTYVIDTLTCRASMQSPVAWIEYPVLLTVAEQPIGSGPGPLALSHTLLLHRLTGQPGTGSGIDYFGVTQPMRVYAASTSSGSTSFAVVAQGGTGPSSTLGITCTSSGHLVAQ